MYTLTYIAYLKCIANIKNQETYILFTEIQIRKAKKYGKELIYKQINTPFQEIQ